MTRYRFNVTRSLKSFYPRGSVVTEDELRASNTPIESLVRLKVITPIPEPKPKAKPKSKPKVAAKGKTTASLKSDDE